MSEPSRAEPLIDGSEVFDGAAAATAEPMPTSTLAAAASAPASTANLLIQFIWSSSVVFWRRYSQGVQAEHQRDVKTWHGQGLEPLTLTSTAASRTTRHPGA